MNSPSGLLHILLCAVATLCAGPARAAGAQSEIDPWESLLKPPVLGTGDHGRQVGGRNAYPAARRRRRRGAGQHRCKACADPRALHPEALHLRRQESEAAGRPVPCDSGDGAGRPRAAPAHQRVHEGARGGRDEQRRVAPGRGIHVRERRLLRAAPIPEARRRAERGGRRRRAEVRPAAPTGNHRARD